MGFVEERQKHSQERDPRGNVDSQRRQQNTPSQNKVGRHIRFTIPSSKDRLTNTTASEACRIPALFLSGLGRALDLVSTVFTLQDSVQLTSQARKKGKNAAGVLRVRLNGLSNKPEAARRS